MQKLDARTIPKNGPSMEFVPCPVPRASKIPSHKTHKTQHTTQHANQITCASKGKIKQQINSNVVKRCNGIQRFNRRNNL